MLKRLIKWGSFVFHRLALRAGIVVVPKHFYVPLSSVLDLERTKHIWARKSDLPGISSTLEEQAENLRRICLPFQSAYAGNHAYREGVSLHFGPGYGYIEAQALHGVLRHYQPSRVIEVGSGVSTYCMTKALHLNEGLGGPKARLTSIEPYPFDALRRLAGVELIQAPVQTIPASTFEELGAGDLLFIDSSHTVRPGSDVNHLILEVLPRLRSGVVVHFHDIYLPYDYQRDVLRTYFQWMETSLLRAFLIHNSRARVLFCLSQLHYDRPEVLKEVFPEYVPALNQDGLEVASGPENVRGHFPSSIFFEVL
jgi:hypothetical protein